MLLYPIKDKQFSNLLPTLYLRKHYKPKPVKLQVSMSQITRGAFNFQFLFLL